MKSFKNYFLIVLQVFILFLAILAILSELRNVEIRYLKMLDFLRIQFFLVSLISLILLLLLIKKWFWFNYLVLAGLVLGLYINGSYLVNYTSLVNVAVPTATDSENPDNSISVLLINVQMSNTNSEALIDLISRKSPDLVLAMEVNERWNEALSGLKKDYPYIQEAVNEKAYGMVLFSKFPFRKKEVNYINNENVPSFESSIMLNQTTEINLDCLHPVPPTHYKNLPDNEGQKEVALLILGEKIKGRTNPTLVIGDLNEVVWSHVDRSTGTENLLFDVRIGRGFYNSYDATNILMRWPLDHIFVTKEFQLQKLERLPKIGSDHFPIFVELVL
ncbi:endonuclease/exonuclease/phosphatase family protein [Algoriphagus antarcticus]|uniref:Endonuclease/exonuclease/phosphatase (EEP) superfamily protein YafD n=1 Tax=Algoriphagus antarcticus TaxID=238540 RepID=A0A3E0E675_9BACT|nr:endonuclease/exonuclease/phosphatase family protein [Algoriphagus antarcticus]REG92779.1 endonuclease/exonuclease/phosphatase (EEP) superfamily protein YafD [Algoriphagus antarcticus]